MPPDDAKTIIHDTLATLPVEERLSALLVSIIQANPNALAVSLRLVRVTATMSKGLSNINRFKVSEAMRDAADKLEQHEVFSAH
jgi:23S rRNA C2498 (ribose-2'-O)-methylase RlmM